MDSSERLSDPLRHRTATPVRDPEEAVIEDTPTRVFDSSKRSGQPEDSPLMATSWILPEVSTSTGVDTGASSMGRIFDGDGHGWELHGCGIRNW